MAFMITWIEESEGKQVKNADPTPYDTEELARQSAKELYPGRPFEVVPYPEPAPYTLSADA